MSVILHYLLLILGALDRRHTPGEALTSPISRRPDGPVKQSQNNIDRTRHQCLVYRPLASVKLTSSAQASVPTAISKRAWVSPKGSVAASKLPHRQISFA